MRNRNLLWAIASLLVVLAAAGGYWLGARNSGRSALPAPASVPTPGAQAPQADAKAQRTVLYWYDPMAPQQKFDRPGKSPFMDMQLVPKYADDTGDAGGSVSIDSRMTQNLGMRTAKVESAAFERQVAAVGTVQADEHRIVTLQARASGWVERLLVRAANEPVQRGQRLAEIYSPEILAAQEEYLLLSGDGLDPGETALRAAARDRLRFLGVSAEQIETLERTRKADPRVALYAPASGIVSELGVREGSQVNPGMNLFTLVDLSSVWVLAQVPETRVAWIAPGARTQARLQAVPGHVFEGRVDYLYPEVDTATRTLRVRSVLRNPGLKLRPGMVAEVTIAGGARRQVLQVPSEAVIYTGARNVVIVAQDEGRFRAVEVRTGMDAQGRTEILAGLEAGQDVVVSGQFLIDSEASLTSALARLDGHQAGAQPDRAQDTASTVHQGEGVVERIDTQSGEVTLAHGPVPALNWPAMTMGFAVEDKTALSRLKPGQTVRFEFKQGNAGGYVILRMEPKS